MIKKERVAKTVNSKNISINYEHIVLNVYGICVFLYAILQSNISIQYPFIKQVILSVFIFLLIICLIIKYKATIRKREAFLLTLFLVLLGYNILNNGLDDGTLLIIPFCYLLSDCNIESILKKYSIAIFFALIFIIMLAKIRILNNQTFFSTSTFKIRQSLGFIWATFGPNMFLSAVLAFVSYKKERIKFSELFAFLLVNLYFYKKTKTVAVLVV